MKELLLLHLNFVHLSSGFELVFRRLLWLSWKGCPLLWLPSKLYMEKLVALDLSYSKLRQVWKGTKDLNNLKFLFLSHCYYLTKTPNFSGLNNLEELLIDNCTRLVKIDESIGCLNKLILLNVKNCIKLQQLPSRILMLKSLEYVDLSGCSKVGVFAGFKGSPSKSLYRFFSSWALPRKNVDSIGFSLQGLRSLKTLKIANQNLSYLPSEIGSLVSLTHLDIRGNNLCMLSDSIYNLTCLESLCMEGCHLSHLPSKIWKLNSLVNLNINRNNLRSLPNGFCMLTNLRYLSLTSCARLQSFPELPESIRKVSAWGCVSLDYNFVENFINAVSHKVEIYLACVEVPRWFDYQCEGSYLSFKVPPLTNHKILGLIICVVIGFNSNENWARLDVWNYEVHINKVPILNEGRGGFAPAITIVFRPMSELKSGDEVEIFVGLEFGPAQTKCAAKLIYDVYENNADTNDEALTDYISSPFPSAIQEEDGEDEEEDDHPTKRRRIS